jgi:uncharacterized protein with NRDE domain
LSETAPRSRGALTDDFVRSTAGIVQHLAELTEHAADYGRFNLLLGSTDELHYVSNHPTARHRALLPGLHGISNGDLDAPWPKVQQARLALSDWLASAASLAQTPDLSPLFAALADPRPAADDALPDTGVGLELERFLSSAFIVGQDYGTRASTVLLMSEHEALLCERRFGPGGLASGESLLRFPIRAD